MKALSKTAAAVFQTAVEAIPADAQSTTIDNAPGRYMALHVEHIGGNHYGELYSFAHYYEQNGDLMRDPDVVMLRSEPMPDGRCLGTPGQFFPLSYRQDGLGIDREYVVFSHDGPGWSINRRWQADLASFCAGWARTLQDQQGLRAAIARAA